MRKVLFIAYYFPPAGGSGVQRPLKFVKYLPENGWLPTVLTVRPEDAAWPGEDRALAGEIPEGVTLIRTKAWDPYAAYARLLGQTKKETVRVGLGKADSGSHWKPRLARWLRGNLFIPDARVGWVPYAVQAGKKLLASTSFDAIITSGPPHSMHLVATQLKSATGLPWIADLADPWTDISYYNELPRSRPARAFEGWLERRVLGKADAVVSVTDGFGELLRRRAELRRYATIFNGFDEADIESDAPSLPDPERFVIAHVGMLTGPQHSPGLVEALAGRVRQSEQWRRRLLVRFVGQVDEAILKRYEEAGLRELIESIPYVPHDVALRYMQQAHLVLAAVQRLPNTKGVVPSKIFEYMRIGTPVLGFGEPAGDFAQIIEQTGGGKVFGHDDAGGIGCFLDEAFRLSLEGRRAAPVDPAHLRKYDRRYQATQLAGLLDEVAR